MAFFDTNWYLNSVGYAAVSVWTASAAIAAGTLRRQVAPAVGSERVFVCITAGTTGGTEPAWSLARGTGTADNTVLWQECTGASAVNGDLTNTPTWSQARAINTSVSQGAIIKRNNGASYQICKTAGIVGASEPAFSDTAGAVTSDSGAAWTSLGVVGNFTGGQAPFARLANVFGTNWFAIGNTVYVASVHAESQATAITINQSLGSDTLPTNILCHNSGSYPPGAANLTTGATISTTAAVAINFNTANTTYIYGLTFKAGVGASSGTTNINISPGASAFTYFDNCSFWLANTAATTAFVAFGSFSNAGSIVLNNSTVKFAAVAQRVSFGYGSFIWKNTGQVLAAGSSVPTSFIVFGSVGTNTYTLAILEALDLSQLTGNLVNNLGGNAFGNLLIKDCKLNATAAVPAPNCPEFNIQLVRCDSGATGYKSTRYAYEGTETTETSITRVGGAVDPTGQAQSRKIVTTVNSQWLRPFKAEPYAVWNPTTGANVTVTVCGTINAGALPNNDDIWLECEYLGDAGLPALPTAFNPADLVNVTLSNANLTVTGTGQGGVRGLNSLTSGKYYFEYTLGTFTNGNSGVGLCTALANLAGVGPTPTAAAVVYNTGAIYVNAGTTGSSLGAISAGNVIGIAMDMTGQLIWFRVGPSGNWNGSGTANPATGTGGIGVGILSSGAYPVVAPGASGNGATANFGGAAFTGAVPSGFTSGLIAPAVPASPLGKIVTTTKSSVLASNAAVASDGSTWGGGGSGAGWSPFKLTATLSSPQPQLAGYLHARVRAAKASTTYYIDPQIVLS